MLYSCSNHFGCRSRDQVSAPLQGHYSWCSSVEFTILSFVLKGSARSTCPLWSFVFDHSTWWRSKFTGLHYQQWQCGCCRQSIMLLKVGLTWIAPFEANVVVVWSYLIEHVLMWLSSPLFRTAKCRPNSDHSLKSGCSPGLIVLRQKPLFRPTMLAVCSPASGM